MSGWLGQDMRNRFLQSFSQLCIIKSVRYLFKSVLSLLLTFNVDLHVPVILTLWLPQRLGPLLADFRLLQGHGLLLRNLLDILNRGQGVLSRSSFGFFSSDLWIQWCCFHLRGDFNIFGEESRLQWFFLFRIESTVFEGVKIGPLAGYGLACMVLVVIWLQGHFVIILRYFVLNLAMIIFAYIISYYPSFLLIYNSIAILRRGALFIGYNLNKLGILFDKLHLERIICLIEFWYEMCLVLFWHY